MSSSSSNADMRDSVMPTKLDFSLLYLIYKSPVSAVCVEIAHWVGVSRFALTCRRMPETREMSFLNLSFSFVNFFISDFWFLSVFFKVSISDMSSSTWFWRDILSFISAWISMLVAKSLASKRSIISSLDSGIVLLLYCCMNFLLHRWNPYADRYIS